MVSINAIHSFILQGNTYANLPAVRACGANWCQRERCWKLQIRGHPMNNVKQRKKLEKLLTDLEENGVRFVAFKEVNRDS
jgi:hypothetical protein